VLGSVVLCCGVSWSDQGYLRPGASNKSKYQFFPSDKANLSIDTFWCESVGFAVTVPVKLHTKDTYLPVHSNKHIRICKGVYTNIHTPILDVCAKIFLHAKEH